MKKIIIILGLLAVAPVWATDTIMSSTVSSSGTVTVDKTPNTANSPSVMVNQQDTCLVGVSGAAQTSIIGISGGTTQRDENCERIKLSRQMFSMGMKVAAVAIMCQDQRVFSAMEQSGTPCPVEGQIGASAARIWEAVPEARPDYALIKDQTELRRRMQATAKVIEAERAERVKKAKEELAAQQAQEAAAEAKKRAEDEARIRAEVESAQKVRQAQERAARAQEAKAASAVAAPAAQDTVKTPSVVTDTPKSVQPAAPVTPAPEKPQSVVKKPDAKKPEVKKPEAKCDAKDPKCKPAKPDDKKADKKPEPVVKKPKQEDGKHLKPAYLDEEPVFVTRPQT